MRSNQWISVAVNAFNATLGPKVARSSLKLLG